MISDSPYQARVPVLSGWGGLGAGVVAAVAMIVLLALLQPISAMPPLQLLTDIGKSLAPNAGSDGWPWIGLGVHFLVGAIFGLFYAVSQERIARGQLIGV